MSAQLRVNKITNSIILLNMDTQKEISELLIRFQEYYESPIPSIRGQIFTLGYLKQQYSASSRTGSGAFTYHNGHLYWGDWNGFNFPGSVIAPFARGLFDPLTLGEQDVVELFKYRDDDFYIIGTHNEDGEDYTVEHEILHGLFYTEPEYKKEALEILGSGSEFSYDSFKKMLKNWGYCDEVLDDETQAYIGADYEWLKTDKLDELQMYDIQIPDSMYEDLQKAKKKYFKPVDSWLNKK